MKDILIIPGHFKVCVEIGAATALSTAVSCACPLDHLQTALNNVQRTAWRFLQPKLFHVSHKT